MIVKFGWDYFYDGVGVWFGVGWDGVWFRVVCWDVLGNFLVCCVFFVVWCIYYI